MKLVQEGSDGRTNNFSYKLFGLGHKSHCPNRLVHVRVQPTLIPSYSFSLSGALSFRKRNTAGMGMKGRESAVSDDKGPPAYDRAAAV